MYHRASLHLIVFVFRSSFFKTKNESYASVFYQTNLSSEQPRILFPRDAVTAKDNEVKTDIPFTPHVLIFTMASAIVN